MASLAWTSSSVKGDLDVVVSMEEMAKGCSKTRGWSFLGQEVAWYYLCIRYHLFQLEPVQCFDSCFDRHLASSHDDFHDFRSQIHGSPTREWLVELLAAFLFAGCPFMKLLLHPA